MLTLRDIMTPDPLTMNPEMTLRDAIEKLSAAGVSGAPVVSGTQLVGVISLSDILDLQSSSPGVPTFREDQQEWGEWGPADVWEEEVSGPPSAYFREMWSSSSADLVERMSTSEGPEWDVLADHQVGEVMTRQILALPPDTDVAEGARLMAGRKIHRLIIAEEHALIGIVSSMDFVRATAEERLSPRE